MNDIITVLCGVAGAISLILAGSMFYIGHLQSAGGVFLGIAGIAFAVKHLHLATK